MNYSSVNGWSTSAHYHWTDRWSSLSAKQFFSFFFFGWVGAHIKYSAHTARASMEVVRHMFPQHVISRFGPRAPLINRFVGIPQGESVHEQTTNDPRAETFHSSRNRSCVGRHVGECDAEFWGEAPNVCPARRTSSDWHYFPYLM
jgi:hypothetical protein